MHTSFSVDPRQRRAGLIAAVLVVAAVVGIRALQAERSIYTAADLERFSATSSIDTSGWPTDKFFLNWVGGDGQVFAAFAADPIHGGSHVKDSVLRFTRAGYSWAAAAITFGNDQWVPYGLVIVNALAVAFVAYLAVTRNELYGKRIWWLLANPSLYIAFMGDTSEALGGALLVASLVWSSVTAALLMGAVRPEFLTALVTKPRLLIAGGLAALAMRIAGNLIFVSPVTNGVYNIDWPLVGYFEVPTVSGFVVAGAALFSVVVGLYRRRWSWVATGTLILLFAAPIHLSGQVNVIRAAGALPIVWALDPAPARSLSPSVTKTTV